MLSKIKLKNFKCFEKEAIIPLTGLNLFTGINGRGKSTALQALLLMRQSSEYSRAATQLTFNGSLIEIGNFIDVKNNFTSTAETIAFSFTFNDDRNHVELRYLFKENEEDDMAADIEKVDIKGRYKNKNFECAVFKDGDSYRLKYEGENYPVTWNNLIFSDLAMGHDVFEFVQSIVEFEKLHYVSANRIGPQDFYPRQSTFEFPNVGARGEFTANILSLAKKKQETVPGSLAADQKAPDTVLGQTEAWLKKIFDGGRIDIKTLEANIVVVQMNSEDAAAMFKPLNIGFGYSYALPIIVSGLIAKKGEMLIVENPEAHLHPYAQSQLAKFLAKVSQNGVQVFVESHSDHILNGLRVAAADKIITAADLNILYFHREDDIKIVKIPVEDDGAINNWPPGFFDQTDKDFERLFGV
jgi:predicted ATPase